MAAEKKRAAAKGNRASQRGRRGRMPTKRSINLVLIDENRISPLKAVPAILLIIALAVAFSKYMVADRLIEMARVQQQARGMQGTLVETQNALNDFEGIEDAYAHMTYAGMSAEEMGRVNRVSILELVSSILPQGEYTRSWSVTGNILTVEITGRTLEYLNELSRRIEESPIVDTCAISTAVKNQQQVLPPNGVAQSLAGALEARRQQVENGLADFIYSSMIHTLQPVTSERVQARLTIYLIQPTEEAAAPENAEGTEAGGDQGEQVRSGPPGKPSRTSSVSTPDESAAESEEVSAP